MMIFDFIKNNMCLLAAVIMLVVPFIEFPAYADEYYEEDQVMEWQKLAPVTSTN